VERWVVTLAAPDGELTATVQSRPSEVAGRLTCSARHPAHMRVWHLDALRAGPG
jgi:hypothetical protein